jgi:hypothetical protein
MKVGIRMQKTRRLILQHKQLKNANKKRIEEDGLKAIAICIEVKPKQLFSSAKLILYK